MIGKANISKANVMDEEDEVITVSCYAKECGSEKKGEEIILKFYELIEEMGGETPLTTNVTGKGKKKSTSSKE